jgi:pimeloyl-ACP methyl ester carboxylesterase
MNSYRIEQLADDLAEVLTQRRVSGPLTLVGHSMGGMAALCYLARPVADRPIEPHGLVLVASAAGKLSERGLGRLLNTHATSALFGLIDRTPARALQAVSGPLGATLHRCCQIAGKLGRVTLAAVAVDALASTPAPTAVGFLPALRRYDLYRTLGSIRANTVVVSGGADLVTPPSHSRDLAVGIPGAAHMHLPKAGHMLPQQAPHVINEAIRRAMKHHTQRGCSAPAS